MMRRLLCTRRTLGWSAFALLLAGLAWALYAWLPPEPRWSVRGLFGVVTISPDGSTVTLWRAEPAAHGDDKVPQVQQLHSPLTIHDVHTGDVRATFSSEPAFAAWTQSPDELTIAAATSTGHVWIADVQQGTEWHVDLGKPAVGALWLACAPDGARLAVMDQRAGIHLLQTRTGRILRSWPATLSRMFIPRFCDNGDFFVWEDLGAARWAGDGELHIWNVRTDQPAGVLKHATCLAIAADGKTLFAAKKEGDERDERNFSHVVLWDVIAGRPRGQIGTFTAGRMGMALSPDERIAALWTEWPDARVDAVQRAKGEGRGYIEFWDVAACRCLGRDKVEMSERGIFSPDGQSFLLINESNALIFDPRTGQRRWSNGQRWDGVRPWAAFFTGDSSTVGWPEAEGYLFRWAASGEVRHTLPYELWGYVKPNRATGQARLLVIRSRKADMGRNVSLWERVRAWMSGGRIVVPPPPEPEAIRVIDTQTLEPLFELVQPDIDRAILSDDGSTLVTLHDIADGAQLLRCYDVPERRPWTRIVGIPLATGVTLIVICGAWRRLRRPRRQARRAGGL